jgi:hypothetical protein
MELQQHIERLDAVGEVSTWVFDSTRSRHTLELDGYTIHIEAEGDHYLWMLEHERYGVIMPWAPANTRAKAREDGLAYWRAHLHGHFQHAHAE